LAVLGDLGRSANEPHASSAATANLNRHNPYEAPVSTDTASENYLAQDRVTFWRLLAVIIPVTAWAIFRTSPIGILLPGAIGVAAAIHKSGSLRAAPFCIALAYCLGVTLIFCAYEITNGYDPLVLNDDDLRPKITAVWAALGILGAVGGAMLGARLSHSNEMQRRAEP